MKAYLERVGFWAPGFPTAEAFLAEQKDVTVTEPACSVVAGRAKRGTSRITRMLGEVATQAAEGADLSHVPILFASAWGEIETMIDLLNQICDGADGLSPIRFKNSVHNAASGLVSIATKNKAFSTAIAAGSETFEFGMLEAFSVLFENDGAEKERVILVVGDDSLPEPLNRYGTYEGAAVAFRLSRTDSDSLCSISFPRYCFSKHANPCPNPAERSFPLLRALREKKDRTLSLGNIEIDVAFPSSGALDS